MSWTQLLQTAQRKTISIKETPQHILQALNWHADMNHKYIWSYAGVSQMSTFQGNWWSLRYSAEDTINGEPEYSLTVNMQWDGDLDAEYDPAIGAGHLSFLAHISDVELTSFSEEKLLDTSEEIALFVKKFLLDEAGGDNEDDVDIDDPTPDPSESINPHLVPASSNWHYKFNQVKTPETIGDSAIMHQGELYTGNNHAECYVRAFEHDTGLRLPNPYDIASMGQPDSADAWDAYVNWLETNVVEENSGFVTSSGRFVNRSEAARIAKREKQLGVEVSPDYDRLDTNDLTRSRSR